MKFERFKSRGSVVFDKDHMNQLLDSLEDSKDSLNDMLNSRHVAPLQDEAAVWSLKLNEVSEVLEEVTFIILSCIYSLVYSHKTV